MIDTRERARELAEDLTDSLYCGAGDEWKHKLDAGKIQTALESEAALARKQEREANCSAICTHCSSASNSSKYTGKAEKRNGKWVHQEVGFKAEDAFDCRAAAIHERNLAETGG